MKQVLLGLVVAAAMLTAGMAEIIEGGMGMIYGNNHAYALWAPKGWMLDNQSGVPQGVHAVFYPKGGSWQGSKVVAYSQARPRTKAINTADDAAAEVVRDFHAHGSPNYVAKRMGTITTRLGYKATIYHFSGDQWGNYEAVAYYVEQKTINYVVLHAKTEKLFKASLRAFEQLTNSYAPLGDDPFGKEQLRPKKKRGDKES